MLGIMMLFAIIVIPMALVGWFAFWLLNGKD